MSAVETAVGVIGLAAAIAIAVMGWLLKRAWAREGRLEKALEDEASAHSEHVSRLTKGSNALEQDAARTQERAGGAAGTDPRRAREYLDGVLEDTADAIDALRDPAAPVPPKRDH